MAQAADRVQPTKWEFPEGSRVRFFADVENARAVRRDDDTKDHWRLVKVAGEGDTGVVTASGDCDPYPTPYAWVELDGDEQRRVLVRSPSRRIVVLGSERDLDEQAEQRIPYEEFPESLFAFERHLYGVVEQAYEVEATFVHGWEGVKGIVGWEAAKYLRDHGITDKGDGIRFDDVEGDLILAVVGAEKVQEYDADEDRWERRCDVYFKFFDERGRVYAVGDRYDETREPDESE